MVCSLWGTVSTGNVFLQTELIAENPDPAAYDSFGWDVAMDGHYAVVGSPWLDADPARTGYAHVYHKEDGLWSHQTSLVPGGILPPGDVGIGVGIYADETNVRIITGNRADASATVWKRTETTWINEGTWLRNSGTTFGSAARIHANHVVIGANGENKMYTARFDDTGWSEEVEELDTSTAGSFGNLGYRVDIDEDWIVGGAYSTNSLDGAVLFWKRNADTANWDYHSRIDAQTGSAGYFGISCDLDGGLDGDPDGGVDRAIVGARACNGGDGKVFIYKYNTDTGNWEQEAAIDGHAGSDEWFGSAVSLDGNTAVIGACCADVDSHTNAGAAYLYTFDGEDWNFLTTLTADVPVAGQTFGSAVDADGNALLVGGPYRQGDRRHGAAYLFESTIPGDANLDGRVDDQDASILAAHWQQSEMSWANGDFNNDGRVDDQDASILAAHWHEGVSEGTSPVPEPATAVLLAGILLPLMFRRVRVSFR
jgi:hypothetical protein